ncbi:MAG: hypothetical protein HOI53_02370, partial [Francisellaceae bacterium]|nr:hypothetical protein [Francisellaceae bacterium]
DGEIDKIREKVKSNMKDYLEKTVETKVRDNVLEALVTDYSIELPETLVNREIENFKKERSADNQETLEEDKLLEEARKRVQVSLVLEHVITEHKLTPDEDRVRVKLNEVISMLGGNFQMVQQLLNNSSDFYNNIRQQVLADQATDLILEKAKIISEASTFKEITGEVN